MSADPAGVFSSPAEPWLVEWLLNGFRHEQAIKREAKQKLGASAQAEEAVLQNFEAYARGVLNSLRPSTISAVAAGNYVVHLTDGTRLLISPVIAQQLNTGAVDNSGYAPITGVDRLDPATAAKLEDRTKPMPQVGLRQSQPITRLA